MPGKKPWNVDTTHSLEAFGEFARKKAGASVVLIVRDKDYALAGAPGIKAEDLRAAIEFVLPSAVELAEARAQEQREAETRRRAAKISAKCAELGR